MDAEVLRLKEEEAWARELRRRRADWDFINRQAPRIRHALRVYVETGDLYKAAKIAGLSLSRMDEVRRKARIPSA
mgnify:CR=1 FL=1